MGLGIGAAGAAFTLLDRMVLEPLPIRDEGTVVVVRGRHRSRALEHFPYTFAAWQHLTEGSHAVSSVAATDASGARERLVEGATGPTPLLWSRVLGDFFGVLDVTPVLGRTLATSDDVSGGPSIAVVSHGLWLRRWGGDDSVLDATLTVGDRTYTVVGVLPRDFDYPAGTDVWTPTRTELGGRQDFGSRLELDLLARLAPGATGKTLGQEIRRLLSANPALASLYDEIEPDVLPLRDALLGSLSSVAWLLFTGALLLAFVATSNVAHLVLLRANEHRLAEAVRRSLGATRARLLTLPLVESVAVTLLTTIVATTLVVVCLRLLPSLTPSDLPRLESLEPTGRTGAAMGVMLMLAAALLTVIPAVDQDRRSELADALRRGRGPHRHRRTARGAIVAGQSALALWSVVAAALLVRSVAHLEALDTGFAPDGLDLVQLDHSHRLFSVPAGWPDRAREVMERLAARPDIGSATAVVAPPLVGRGGFDIVPDLPGDSAANAANPYVNLELTLPGYFETLRLPLLRGRPTRAADRDGAAPVLVVNAAAERTLWPGQSALGKRLRLPFPGYEQTAWTVVGVADDARYRELLEVRPSLYVPLAQMPLVAPRWVVVRTARPTDAARAVAEALSEIDPSVRVVGSSSVGKRMAAPLARPRLALSVLVFLAGLVLLFAAVGAYGAVTADVRSRGHEIGVRVACGASPADIGRLFLGNGLTRATTGMVVGGLAALATGHVFESLLFGVEADDPVALTTAAGVVLAATVAACARPAVRATRLDPTTLLHNDG